MFFLTICLFVICAVYFLFMKNFFIEKKDEELYRLRIKFSSYEDKMIELNKIMKYATKSKDLESIDNILIRYIPVNKVKFVRLQIECKLNINNNDVLFIFIIDWVKQEMLEVENILIKLKQEMLIVENILNESEIKLDTVNKQRNDKLSFIKRIIS